MDDLEKQLNEIDQQLRDLPRERDEAIREVRAKSTREIDGLTATYTERETDLRRQRQAIDTRIRSIERPVGTLF